MVLFKRTFMRSPRFYLVVFATLVVATFVWTQGNTGNTEVRREVRSEVLSQSKIEAKREVTSKVSNKNKTDVRREVTSTVFSQTGYSTTTVYSQTSTSSLKYYGEFNLTIYLEEVKSGRMKPFRTRSFVTENWLSLTPHIPDEKTDKNLCELKHPHQEIEVLFLIISRANEREFRETIRKTWCSYSQQNTANMRCVFLLGNNENGTALADARLAEEVKTHSDIVIGRFKENYRNCTLKVIMGFQWAKKFCSKAKFVVKSDVDVWIHIPYLQYLLKIKNINSAVAGRRFRPSIVRDVKSKWGTAHEEWSVGTTYGETCAGAAYVLTMNSTIQILKIAEVVPFNWIEDVYVSVCAKALNYKIIQLPGFEDSNDKYKDKCDFKNGKRALAHMRNVQRLKKIWETDCS